MPAKPNPQDLRDILAQNREAALSYANQVGRGNVYGLLQHAEKDLLARIDGLGLRGTFTETHLRTMLSQVRLVTSQLVDNISGTLVDAADPMSSMAAQGTLDYMTQADATYRGVATGPLGLREAGVLDSAREGARASLLRRIMTDEDHPGQMGVMQRYGMNTVEEFERTLRVGVLTRKSVDEVTGDLTSASTFLQGKPSFWAERIARTEMMGAYNRASWESQREVNEQLDGDMVKILSATFDDRTAADSYAVHGQIRLTDEAFETWYGLMQHPPARPNDREIVVPHRIAWEIPKYLLWKTDDEVAARWRWEGRKTEMPERPLMTTVDLDRFGREDEKKEDEEEGAAGGVPPEQAGIAGMMGDLLGDELIEQRVPDVGENLEGEPIDLDADPDDPDAPDPLAFEPDPEDPTKVLHEMPSVRVPFWDVWSEAEQELLRILGDNHAADDTTAPVDTDDVILKGRSIKKKTLDNAIEAERSGTASPPSLIKRDDLYYAHTLPSAVVAKKALGAATFDAYVVDLDDPKVAGRFPSMQKGREESQKQPKKGPKKGR